MLPALYKEGNYPYDIEEEVKNIDIVDTVEALDELLSYLDGLEARGIVTAVDTETTGVNPKEETPSGKGVVVTLQVSWIEEADQLSLQDLVTAIMHKEVEPTRVWVDCRNPRMLLQMKRWLTRKEAP